MLKGIVGVDELPISFFSVITIRSIAVTVLAFITSGSPVPETYPINP
jgi:hypothetical protein